MDFKDGMAYDFMTPVGIVTIVCDGRAAIPIRIYGPDGLQIDPVELARLEGRDSYLGFLSFDLRKFSPRRKRKGDV